MTETRSQGFGLHNSRREASQIERQLGITLKHENFPETLKAHEGSFLEIFFGDSTVSGIYRGVTEDGAHVLMPTVHPNGDNYLVKDAPLNKRYTWLNLPVFIIGQITGFRPASRQLLEAAAEGYHRVQGLGKSYDLEEEKRKIN